MRCGRGLATGLLVSAACAAGLGLPVVAAGQEQVMVMRSVGPAGTSFTPVSARELEGYCRTLRFDAGQSEAAQMLLEGYREAVRAAQNDQRAAMEQTRLEFEDTREHETLMEGMRTSAERFRTRTEELETSFFKDLKSLTMGEQQESQWPRVERARRRAKEIDQGPVSTANVDVIALVEGAAGSWLESETVVAILQRYELQLDSLLAERTRAGAPLEAGMMQFDPARLEAMNEAVEKQREVALRIRQLNDAVVAELLAQAGEQEERAALESAYQMAKFPRVYRDSYTSRLLAAAAGFDDLTAPQREAVASLQAAHAAQAASLNGRWARELAEAEKSGEESSGGLVIRFGGEEEEDTALGEASRARRDLDQDTESRLRDVLEEDQEKRLPERERQAQEQWVGGGEMIRIRGG